VYEFLSIDHHWVAKLRHVLLHPLWSPSRQAKKVVFTGKHGRWRHSKAAGKKHAHGSPQCGCVYVTIEYDSLFVKRVHYPLFVEQDYVNSFVSKFQKPESFRQTAYCCLSKKREKKRK
jgi:hypothetical protein